MLQEFLGATEGRVERGAVVLRPSPRAAVGRAVAVFLTLFWAILPFALGYILHVLFNMDVEDPGTTITGGFMAVLLNVAIPLGGAVAAAVAPAVQILFTRYIFDDAGIRVRRQILEKQEARVQWEKVTDLIHRRTILDRILGIERVEVVAYGARGTRLQLLGLRHGAAVRDLVARHMRASSSITRLLRSD